MPFLAINAATYWVLDGGAQQQESERIGESRRAIDGTLRSGVHVVKRSYRFQLEPMSIAAYAALDALASTGDFVAVTGDAVVAGDYELRIVDAGYVIGNDAASHTRAPTIMLVQV
jgi:hypothetical protein